MFPWHVEFRARLRETRRARESDPSCSVTAISRFSSQAQRLFHAPLYCRVGRYCIAVSSVRFCDRIRHLESVWMSICVRQRHIRYNAKHIQSYSAIYVGFSPGRSRRGIQREPVRQNGQRGRSMVNDQRSIACNFARNGHSGFWGQNQHGHASVFEPKSVLYWASSETCWPHRVGRSFRNFPESSSVAMGD